MTPDERRATEATLRGLRTALEAFPAGDPMCQGIMAGINACYDQLLSPEEKQQFAREMESWQKEQDKQTTPIAPVYFHGNATCNGEKIPHISDYSPTDPFK